MTFSQHVFHCVDSSLGFSISLRKVGAACHVFKLVVLFKLLKQFSWVLRSVVWDDNLGGTMSCEDALESQNDFSSSRYVEFSYFNVPWVVISDDNIVVIVPPKQVSSNLLLWQFREFRWCHRLGSLMLVLAACLTVVYQFFQLSW